MKFLKTSWQLLALAGAVTFALSGTGIVHADNASGPNVGSSSQLTGVLSSSASSTNGSSSLNSMTGGASESGGSSVNANDSSTNNQQHSQVITGRSVGSYNVEYDFVDETGKQLIGPTSNSIGLGTVAIPVVARPSLPVGYFLNISKSYYLDGANNKHPLSRWLPLNQLSSTALQYLTGQYIAMGLNTPGDAGKDPTINYGSTVKWVFVYVRDATQFTSKDVTIKMGDSLPDKMALVDKFTNANGQTGTADQITADFSNVNVNKPGTYSVPMTDKDPSSNMSHTQTSHITVAGGGTLSLVSVPDLVFADATLAPNQVHTPLISASSPIVVDDERGTGAGWTLNVNGTNFVNTSDSSKTFASHLVIPVSTATLTGTGAAPTAGYVNIISSGSSAYLTKIMSAAKGTGEGVWKMDLSSLLNNPVGSHLAILGSEYIGQYKSTLTWTLSDAPA